MSTEAADSWLVLPLSKIADFKSGESIGVANLSERSAVTPIPVYGGNGIAGYTSSATVSEPTVILGRVGQKCGVVYQNHGPAWITDNALYAYRFKRPLDMRFLAATLKAARLNDVRNRNDLPLITQAILRDVTVNWPESLLEQRRIANALAEADEFITALERLIAKKQAIKQGMMQQLLTARIRLPGFTAPWLVRSIGQFAEVKAGGTPSTAVPRYWGGDIRWMSSGEVHQKRVREVRGRITADGLRESSAQVFPAGTVLIALAGQGKTRGTVAISEVELSTNQSIAGILPSNECDPDFLYYNLDKRYDELRGESAGEGGRGGLNLTIIKNIAVFMPEIREQMAIARVLADVDDELSVLQERLEKTQSVKTGMMQQLLTGRTRLPVEATE